MSERPKPWLVLILAALIPAVAGPALSEVRPGERSPGPKKADTEMIRALRRDLTEAQSSEEKRQIARQLYELQSALQRKFDKGRQTASTRSGSDDATQSGTATPAAPVLGAPSLTLDGDLSLDDTSSIFKNGELFLWDEEANRNFGVGRGALGSNTMGIGNTAIGRNALANNDYYFYPGGPYGPPNNYPGNENTAVGDGALWYNDGGRANTAVGFEALANAVYYSRENTAVGSSALRNLDKGTRLTAVGNAAMAHTTAGHFNTAIGNRAGTDISYSQHNTAVGAYALDYSPNTLFNTAVGSNALTYAGGSYNSAVGMSSLQSSNGAHNVAVGFVAGGNNDSGNQNVAIGSNALYNSTTGSNNIAVGYYAGYNLGYNPAGPALGGSDNIHIGNWGMDGDNGVIRIGTSGRHVKSFVAGVVGVATDVDDAVAVFIDSAGQLGTSSSSRRYKEDISDMGELSEKLLQLRPVTFRYRNAFADGNKPLQFGLIAEEVAEVFPELVVYDEEGQPETVKYHLLSSLLLNELQKQANLNQEQAKEMTELVALRERLAELEDVKARLVRLEARETWPPRVAAVIDRARSSPGPGER